jgi:D-glycero-beta-D-manno-heptose 1-phosphate adenylyltransferase
MKNTPAYRQKILDKGALLKQMNIWRMLDKKVVFTNGVFDIFHEGHIAALNEAASFGDVLIVAVNSDASVKRLKGPNRPINNEIARQILLANLLMTDVIILFEEDTPKKLIIELLPDVLVKGGDYKPEDIAGAKEILAAGGEVKITGMIEGISTTKIIEKQKGSI